MSVKRKSPVYTRSMRGHQPLAGQSDFRPVMQEVNDDFQLQIVDDYGLLVAVEGITYNYKIDLSFGSRDWPSQGRSVECLSEERATTMWGVSKPHPYYSWITCNSQ